MNEKTIKIFKTTAFGITVINLIYLILFLIPKKIATYFGWDMIEYLKYGIVYLIVFALIVMAIKCIECFYYALIKNNKKEGK